MRLLPSLFRVEVAKYRYILPWSTIVMLRPSLGFATVFPGPRHPKEQRSVRFINVFTVTEAEIFRFDVLCVFVVRVQLIQ